MKQDNPDRALDNLLDEINAQYAKHRLRGECACITRHKRITASCYFAPDFRDSSLVASWIHDLGGAQVEIEHTLYSDDDEARDGLMHGCQAWQVSFSFEGANPYYHG
jgi:hypothetical protein